MKIFAVVLFALGILINPSGAGEAAKSALVTCANTVIPSLFPFFVCSRMLIEMGAAKRLGRLFSPVMRPLFGVGGSGAFAFVIGILSGYPVGASAAADLVKTGQCSKTEAEKLLGYCNNSGPLFILGALGAGLLGNAALGWILYAAHIMSAFTMALLMRNIPCRISDKKREDITGSNRHFGEIMAESVGSGAEAVFTVCGFVIIFAILMGIIESFGIIRLLSFSGVDYDVCKTFVCGLLEPVGGCAAAAKVFFNSPVLRCMMISAVVGWSGISVHLQVLGIIKKEGLSAKYYFLGKTGMMVISPIYTYVLLKLFPGALTTSVFAPSNMESAAPFPYISWFICIAVIFALALQLIPAKKVLNK